MNKTSPLFMEVFENIQQSYGLLYPNTMIISINFYPANTDIYARNDTRRRRRNLEENVTEVEVDFETKIEEETDQNKEKRLKSLEEYIQEERNSTQLLNQTVDVEVVDVASSFDPSTGITCVDQNSKLNETDGICYCKDDFLDLGQGCRYEQPKAFVKYFHKALNDASFVKRWDGAFVYPRL